MTLKLHSFFVFLLLNLNRIYNFGFFQKAHLFYLCFLLIRIIGFEIWKLFCFFLPSVSWTLISQLVSVFVEWVEMARSRSISGYGLWKYLNPAYYLRRPRRLALLFIVFVSVSMVVWDRINLSREHEVCSVSLLSHGIWIGDSSSIIAYW